MAVRQTSRLSLSTKVTITALILAGLVLNWVPHLDALAQRYLSDTIASNAVVFGVVRTLNGVISVVQSAEIGVGVASIHLGEILDPVNDLIESFSGLLLVTLTALGIQQVILLFTTSIALKVVFSVFATLLLLVLWRFEAYVTTWFRVAIAVVLLRFLLTFEVGLVWLFDWLYFNATGEAALSVLEATTQVVQNIKDTLTNIDISQFIFGPKTPELPTEDIGSRISTSVVTLIVGMLFKSIIIPIGTLWCGYKMSHFFLVGAYHNHR